MTPSSIARRLAAVFARLAVSLWIALVCAPPGDAAQPSSGGLPAQDRIVVLISLDGFPAAAFRDPRLPVPHLRRLAREGVAADAMTVANPAVTWANHTSLVTGVATVKHGVLFNGLLLREGADGPLRYEHRDRAELVRVPTVQDVASRAGLTAAQVDWVPPQVGGTVTWAFPEIPHPEGEVEKEMVAAGLVTEKDVREFSQSSILWRDAVWTRAAVHMIRRHKPNLVLLHLLNTDSTHHRHGPGSLAGMTALAYADARVGEVLDALDAEFKGRATVLVVADHGFKGYRKAIRANVALLRAGLLRVEAGKVSCEAFVVPQGGQAQVYVTNPARRAVLVPRLREILSAVPGVDRVLEGADVAALGMPTPAQNTQAGDLLLTAKDGHAFVPGHEGEPVSDVPEGNTPGAHGYVNTDPDMDAIFLAWGYGIRAGAAPGRVNTLDVAPTIAALLGLDLPGVDGRAMEGLLSFPRPAPGR